jgi:hypothetical protein
MSADVTMQELELEHAELLPARETLWVSQTYPRLYPWGPVHDPGGPVHFTGGPVPPAGDPGHMVGTPVYASGD